MPCCKKKELPKETVRRVKANDRAFNDQYKYANNYIKTSKYNFITFLPRNLFEQFQRIANFYFLILMILQSIPQISSLVPYTTIIPLVAVLAMTAIKDAIDDVHRHKSDNIINNRISKVVRQDKLVEEKWQNVKVGDIIKMESDNFVAADLLLLSTSESYGICYIETAELDGETNLKAKQALTETASMQNDLKQIGAFDGEVTCEPPNNRLSSFEGRLAWKGQQYALDNDKILLRGCVLRNTKWCYGLVVFAGRDTKLMMNSGKTTFKRTSLDQFLNMLIIGIIIVLLALVVICTIFCVLWEVVYGKKFRVYLPWPASVPNPNDVAASIAFISFLMFFSYIILLNTLVPISLYVSVEILRLFHSYWINWDLDMYHEPSDTAARARTTTLNEELGQIQYIFSDKTGTLTQNLMTFNKCSINGKVYGEVYDERGNAMEVKNLKQLDFSSNKWFDGNFRWFDGKLIEATKIDESVQAFWRLLALCHTVMPEYKDGKLVYQAQSPDEAALVGAARNFGYVFKSRTPNSITIDVDGHEETYELLCILDFNNVRKRMSVLLRKEGKITLYCKGADAMIFERLSKASTSKSHDTTQDHLDKFAKDGLRTLCLSYKDISPDFYESWKKKQHEASIALERRQEQLDAIYEEIETDMTLIGATAIEDKLQDGVPDTIANLAAANIKIWVLTGDKQETAINIGYSCRLLTDELRDIFIVDGHTFEEVGKQLLAIKEKLAEKVDAPKHGSAENSAHQEQRANGATKEPDDGTPLEGFGLVINGYSLIHALDPKMELLFLDIGAACKAVICCRVTPLQKALVVDLVKRHKKAVTLAIGDGANDVSMIKMAHIGVGISGQEGMQAVLASDFSIAQFRYLKELLLVHGRWSYIRMSKFLRYFFYKNFAYTLTQFWFSFFSAYSAQTVYDQAFMTFYNIVFTSMPVLAMGALEQDVSKKQSLKYPRLYVPGQYNLFFNMRIFIFAVLHGMFTAFIIFFVTYAVQDQSINPQGEVMDGLWVFAFTTFSSLIIAATAQIALDTSYWTRHNHSFIWGSVIVYFLFAIIFDQVIPYNRTLNQNSYGVVFKCMSSANYWFVLLLTTTILTVPVISSRFFRIDTQPTLSDRMRVRHALKRSEIQLLPRSSTRVSRRRKNSVHSSYAFSHEQGFGDLITSGVMAMSPAMLIAQPKLEPIKESPTKEE